MFANLTTTQLVAMILGIVFSGIAVACSFFALRWAKAIKSKIVACAITMIAPFLAITSWFFLIFSYVKEFKNQELFNIFTSIALSLVTCFMILIVSALLLRKNKDKLIKADQEEAEKEKAAQQNAQPAQTEEVEETENLDESKEGEVVENEDDETYALTYAGKEVVDGEVENTEEEAQPEEAETTAETETEETANQENDEAETEAEEEQTETEETEETAETENAEQQAETEETENLENLEEEQETFDEDFEDDDKE